MPITIFERRTSMSRAKLFISGAVGVLLLGLVVYLGGSTYAATRTIEIANDEFLPISVNANVGDTLVWNNTDLESHRLIVRHATNSGLVVVDTILQPVSATDSADTLEKVFDSALIASFEYLVDNNELTKGALVVSALATATPSATVAVSPTASVSASPMPSASPSASPNISPTPSASAIPTGTPAITASPMPTVSPSATASPTASPIMTIAPTSSPLVTASPMPTVTPIPTIAPTLVPTATPASTPVVTAAPEMNVLPGFSVFRKTTCSALFLSNNSIVQTDKLSSAYIKRGTWNVLSLTNQNGVAEASMKLASIRTINLFFGGNPFFSGDMTESGDLVKTFSAPSNQGILNQASSAWCK
jgi:hypothetical protein